jgi:hypothetical protein
MRFTFPAAAVLFSLPAAAVTRPLPSATVVPWATVQVRAPRVTLQQIAQASKAARTHRMIYSSVKGLR